MMFTSSDVRPRTTEAAAMSGDLVQGLSSWERILVARECRCRELGNRLPGCTETLTTPAANGGEKEGYRLYSSVPGVFSMELGLCVQTNVFHLYPFYVVFDEVVLRINDRTVLSHCTGVSA